MRAIFTFHSIDDRDAVLSYSPRYFHMLLDSLSASNIPVHDLHTLLEPGTQRGVALTFDDGMKSVYQNALPAIREHRISAHLFTATTAAGQDKPWPRQAAGIQPYEMLTWDELEKLHAAGIFIESHTHTHPDMRTICTAEMEDECARADDLIERRLGRRPEYFAYPFGYHNREVRDFVRQRYRGAVTTELRFLGDSEDTAALPRLDTFYLRSDIFIRNIDSWLLARYLGARNMLRNIRGSQCRANCD